MKLLVGLGNPGPKYDGTRHNVGFAVVARLAEELQAGRPRAQGPALVSPVRDGSARLVLAQPLTYMNRSGHAVRHLLNFYKIGADELLVIYDDVHLPLGHLRIRAKGSAGGHNGLKSIIQALGHDEFARLRIGIAPDRELPEGALADFVLSKFTASERPAMEAAVAAAAEAARTWASDGTDAAMQRFNGWSPAIG